jgi:hypothetical protein
MSSRYFRGRPRILLESREWAALSFFLFSCFFVLTLPLSDDYWLSLLSYVTGLLALLAVFRFRGPATVMGFLITLFVARYYFAPLLVKTIEGRSIWHNLYSPTETLSVLACSLLTMVVASAFFHEEIPVLGNFRTLSRLKHLRRLVVLTSIVGIAAAVQTAMRQELGPGGPVAEVSTGFLGGAGPIFATVLAFSLSLSIYKALVEDKSVIRNYEVMALLAVNAFFALFSTQRGNVLIILVAVVVPYVLGRQRVRAPLVASILAALLLFVFVLSPVMLYLRSGNLEYYSFSQRIGNFATFWADTVSNPGSVAEYRTEVSAEGHYLTYFENYYGGLERFAILPDSDRVVSGTVLGNQHGGWRTISWAVAMVPPRFVYPDKPLYGPGAYLGHVAGLAAPGDTTTQWVVGFPAEFYHAFSYRGVFIGTVAVLGLFYLALKLFQVFAVDPAWNMLIALYYWNYFPESPLAGLLSTLVALVILVVALDRIARHTRL